MAGHVFISYSRGDAAYVGTLVGYLTSEGIPVWIDEALQPGTPTWVRVVEREIETCQAFLLVMSPNSSDSSWVDRELDLAQELGKPILPLLLSGRRFMRIRDVQTEVVTNGAMPSSGFLAELRRLVGTQPPPTEPPKADSPPEKAAAEDPYRQAFGADGFGDLFDRLFQPQPARGRDVEADIALKPHEAAAGAVVPFALRSPGGCATCHGSGGRPESGRTCAACRGTGLVQNTQGPFESTEPCRDCRGTGTVFGETCPECHGDGTGTRTITVRVPAGVRDGQRIRLAGRGEPGTGEGEAGDLYLTVRVA